MRTQNLAKGFAMTMTSAVTISEMVEAVSKIYSAERFYRLEVKFDGYGELVGTFQSKKGPSVEARYCGESGYTVRVVTKNNP